MMRHDLPLIFVGDLWKAVRALRPADDETLTRIVEIFDLFGDLRESPRDAAGLVSATVPAPAGTDADADPSPLAEENEENFVEDPAGEEPNSDDLVDVGADEEITDSEPQSPGRRILPIRVERLKRPPSTLNYGFVPRPVPPPTDEAHESLPELLPLLNPNWMRAVVTALLSTRSREGVIDEDALVEQIARGALPSPLPRQSVWSMRRGVQLLVDSGSGILPFSRDIDLIHAAMVRLAGPELIFLQRFEGGPWRDLYDVAEGERLPYQLPPHGVPVLLITDFGIGRESFADATAPASQWISFLDGLRGAGVSVVALVPYPQHRWPHRVAARATLIAWDRDTTVLQARMARSRSEK
jgi:hypothetical protein